MVTQYFLVNRLETSAEKEGVASVIQFVYSSDFDERCNLDPFHN